MASHSIASFGLSGTFLITGGTRGLGRAISLEFAGSGAHVISNYIRNETAARELKALADQQELPLELCRADLTTPEGLRQVEAAVQQAPTPFMGFVHCAATGTHRPVSELTARHLEWTFKLNTGAFFDLARILLPKLSGGASMVAVSSPGASRAIPNYAVVGASKGALESLARHLAVELAPRGIRVNVVAPGAIATEAWKGIPDGAAKLADAQKRSPLGRMVTSEEVARAVVFLALEATYTTGAELPVDGGASQI